MNEILSSVILSFFLAVVCFFLFFLESPVWGVNE